MSADRVYYKINSGIFKSGHVEMALGEDDTTTIEFICDIIELKRELMENEDNNSEWYENYGVYREG